MLVVLVVADWLSKYYFNANFHLYQSQQVIGENFLRWTLVYNQGFSFSIGANYPVLMRVLVGSFAVIVAIVLTYLAWKKLVTPSLPKPEKYTAWAFILVASGAFGNGLERIFFGHVTDFIHFTFGTWSFAVFNLADIWINLGIYLLIYNLLFVRAK
ncbi:signal peptidase II [Psittacicella hinzii]